MKIYIKNKLSENNFNKLLKRTYLNNDTVYQNTAQIVNDVKKNGLKAAIKYSKKYDDFSADNIFVDYSEIENAKNRIDITIKKAIDKAFDNIYNYHIKQGYKEYRTKIANGITCSRKTNAIQNVGLYIPGGTAILPSTLLMLGIPAMVAGCKRIVALTPAKGNSINPVMLYVASKLNIKEFVKIGGAQGIALLAFGAKEIKKIDKLFGPGNQYVTAAKSIVSSDINGCAIDMPAGPSEVLVIADKYANPKFVAADLLSQAEHGNDSQSILISDSIDLINRTIDEINNQKQYLSRQNYINNSLNNSFCLQTENIDEAFNFSNEYAPEHLIVNTKNPKLYIEKIENAGSVFIGAYTPESAGDYASGTNHSLPTYGFAKSYSGVRVEDFQKTISFQEISKSGLQSLSSTIISMAECEELTAHANAVKVRLI